MKSGCGPYFGFALIAAIYLWPFAVFHGVVMWVVGLLWLSFALAVTAAGRPGRRNK